MRFGNIAVFDLITFLCSYNMYLCNIHIRMYAYLTQTYLIANQIQGGHEKSGLQNTTLKQEYFSNSKRCK